MSFKDVVAKYGESIAKSIRTTKRELEKTRDEKEDPEPWVTDHPEVKTEEPWLLIGNCSCCSGNAWNIGDWHIIRDK